MKLSAQTQSILKHMSSINRGINIQPGSTIRTMSPERDILMKTEVEETFDKPLVVFDLPRFLGTLNLFTDPDIELHDKFALITEKGTSNAVRYTYADESVCEAVTKDIKLPSADISFTLTAKNLDAMIKAASVLGVADITVRGDGTKMTILVHNKAIDSTDTYGIDLGATDKKFNVDFKAEKLKLIPADYEVEISSKRLSKFMAVNSEVTYWIGVEFTSKFE